VKLAGNAAQKAAQKDLSPRFVMLSGPDSGVLRRMAMMIGERHLKANPSLETKRFSEDDVRADPGGVEEAIASPSLFGGAAIAQVRVSNERDAGALAALLERVDKGGPSPEGILILTVGELSATSKSRKLFEASQHAWALQFYESTRDELANVARQEANLAGATLEPDALGMILDTVAQDSDSIAAEVSKLAIYAGEAGVIDVAAVRDVGSGGREAGIDDAIDAAFGGHTALMATRLEQAIESGVAVVPIVNAVGRHIRMLMQIQAAMANGAAVGEAVKNPRLRVFWKRQSDVVRQAGLWGRAPLEEALRATLEADGQIKRGGSPDEALVERLLTRIAKRAARGQGR
jgi:DNA polymerase III subunit delta